MLVVPWTQTIAGKRRRIQCTDPTLLTTHKLMTTMQLFTITMSMTPLEIGFTNTTQLQQITIMDTEGCQDW